MNKKIYEISIGAKLSMTFLGFAVIVAITFGAVYQSYVPKLINKQVELRALSVAKSFSAAVLEPMMIRNYLRVNKIAEVTAKLPDVAYASVFNKRGFPIAGIIGSPKRFDDNFIFSIKSKGFPRDIIKQNKAPQGDKSNQKILVLGQKKILDIALASGNNGAEVHLGLFVGDIQKAIRASLTPLLMVLIAMAILGLLGVIFIGRTISTPIRQLTEQVQAISMGELDQKIDVKGSGEITELVESFKRMQASLQFSAQQMKKDHD